MGAELPLSAATMPLREAAETPQRAPVSYGRIRCPECLVPFLSVHPRKIFCCKAHEVTFANRMTVRGRTLTALVMAAHITRGGTRGDTATGIRARRDAEHLMRRWAMEDREAGRMSATDYVALRYRKGFEVS